jgi:serine/threonine protein kinase
LSSYKPPLNALLWPDREIAKSLLLFHSANWMHKALSSRNILFFPPSSTAPRSLVDLYIVDFEYSRPDLNKHPSRRLEKIPETDTYRHRDCLKEEYATFHKTYDVYSLGLVLLEIAK